MFRIEVIPFDYETKRCEKSQTLHVCLNTCQTKENHQHKHLIASIGRKNNDITIERDKCISRCHAYLSLIHIDDDNELNPEEKAACQNDCCGVALVVEDQGSKFGTTIVQNIPFETKTHPNKDGDDDETDDATDDEMQGKNAVNKSSIANASQQQFRHKTKLQPKTPFILHALSYNSDNISSFHKLSANDSPKSSIKPSVTIVFGVTGSKIQVTRVPLSFCFTTFDKTKLNATKTIRDQESDSKEVLLPTPQQLQKIGAISTTSWINSPKKQQTDKIYVPTTTHLVAQQFKTSAKFLTALISKTPICTLDYINDLLQRTSMKVDLPSTDDYIPTLPSSSKETSSSISPLHQSLYQQLLMAKKAPSLTKQRSLEQFLFIVLIEDDISNLVSAAGAQVYPSYMLSSDDFSNMSWLNETYKLALSKNLTLVVLECTSRKVRKRMKSILAFIKEQQTREEHNNDENDNKAWKLYVTTAKEVAQAVTSEGALLKDCNGNEIQATYSGDDKDTNDSIRKDEGMAETSVEFETSNNTHETSSSHIYSSQDQNTLSQMNLKRCVSSLNQTNNKRVKKSHSNDKDSANSGGWTASKNITSSQMTHSSDLSELKTAYSSELKPSTRTKISHVSKIESKNSPRNVSKANNSSNNIPIVSNRDENLNAVKSRVKRRRLPKTKDGWFVTAPSDPKSREKFKRKCVPIHVIATVSTDEQQDFETKDNENETIAKWIEASAAITESIPGLIVRQRINTKGSYVNDGSKKNKKHARSKKKDYKRFRKNNVLYHADMPVKIAFRSVLPKESERERQLQLSQEELDKEQMIADALFSEEDGGKGRRGRGRGARGGILQFLTPPSEKQKRRGRR